MFLLTNDQSILKNSIDMYNWLKESSLVTDTGIIYDGQYATQCSQMEKNQHSYNSGLFLSGAGWLFKATGDIKYLTDAKVLLIVKL